MERRALVIGATGTMGQYLVPYLLDRGMIVDGLTADASAVSNNPNLNLLLLNGGDPEVLKELLKTHYEVIVDFLCYDDVEKFKRHATMFLENTDQYVFLSSYRVYADPGVPVTETSPRLWDVSEDKEYLASNNYSLYKAEEEDFLRSTGRNNFTILRPGPIYASLTMQLVSLLPTLVAQRSFEGKKVVLPEEVMDKHTTMTWGGDAARLIAGLIGNPKALGEAFTISTNEHHTWREVAELFKETMGTQYVTTDWKSYWGILTQGNFDHDERLYKLIYDRMFDRVLDVSKVLEVSGCDPKEFRSLKEGMKYEVSRVDRNIVTNDQATYQAMDEWLAKNDI